MLPEDAAIHERHESGEPMRVWLTSPADIDGVPCAAWFVYFHANGRLEMAAIARSCVVRGWELGPHDTLYLRDTGALDLVHLHPPRTVAGRADVASVRFDDAEGIATFTVGDTKYDASGVMLQRRVEPDAVAEIAGVVCTGTVDFHPNGSVGQTRLGGPITSRHGEVPTRSLVELDDRGELTTAFVGGPCTLGGTDFEANDSVDFTGVAPEKRAGAWTFASIPS